MMRFLIIFLGYLLVIQSVYAKDSWQYAGAEETIQLNVGFKISGQHIFSMVSEMAAFGLSDEQTIPAEELSVFESALGQSVRQKGFNINTIPDGDTVIWSREGAPGKLIGQGVFNPACNGDVKFTSRAVAWQAAYDCLKSLNEPKYAEAFTGGEAAIYVIEPVLDGYDKKAMRKWEKYEARALADRQQRHANNLSESRGVLLQPAARTVPPSPVWPAGLPGWHLGDKYSQLQAAAAQVQGMPSVWIAHLDTGYLPTAPSKPEAFDEHRSVGCNKDGCYLSAEDEYLPGLLKSPGHGARTLSTLAGKPWQQADGTIVQLGAAPNAKVFSVKIGDSVVHWDSRAMGEGILYATHQGADIITLSHGGLPSARLIAAVNEAYDNGTAIFAATGDYFDVPILGHTFREVVYPARFSRVMGVAGATSACAGQGDALKDCASYGDNPSWRWLFKFGPGYFGRMGSWMLRGNYGPASVMKDHVITAYVPNVTHASATPVAPGLIAHNGAGTSHATPQVAAAASFWLQKNRAAFSVADWRSWKKSEAVYGALAQSAETCFVDYTVAHYGVGLLKAKDALDYRYADNALLSPTGERTPLQSRAAASWEIQEILSLIRSTTLFNAFDGKVQDALREAVTTELMQVILTSDRLQELLEKAHACKKEQGCEICRRQDFNLKQFADRLRSVKEASPTLKVLMVQAADKQAWLAAP